MADTRWTIRGSYEETQDEPEVTWTVTGSYNELPASTPSAEEPHPVFHPF